MSTLPPPGPGHLTSDMSTPSSSTSSGTALIATPSAARFARRCDERILFGSKVAPTSRSALMNRHASRSLILQRDFLEFTLLTAHSVPSIGASPV
jgi:hypothetical protein